MIIVIMHEPSNGQMLMRFEGGTPSMARQALTSAMEALDKQTNAAPPAPVSRLFVPNGVIPPDLGERP